MNIYGDFSSSVRLVKAIKINQLVIIGYSGLAAVTVRGRQHADQGEKSAKLMYADKINPMIQVLSEA